jgi:hypothetical protein
MGKEVVRKQRREKEQKVQRMQRRKEDLGKKTTGSGPTKSAGSSVKLGSSPFQKQWLRMIIPATKKNNVGERSRIINERPTRRHLCRTFGEVGSKH